jgi:Mlc titration factor MtfA (ptsG expression regulator)
MLFARWRRSRIARRPFSAEWERILQSHIPLWNRLGAADRDELRVHISVFIAEKTFEGCAGLELTDEIRVVIAAQACLLLLHRETDYYPTVSTILVYPHAYRATGRRAGPGGAVIEDPGVRLGEMARGISNSLGSGPIVLSWNSVLHGASDMQDGHNVVMHEFAHALDAESGGMNGAPALGSRSMYTAWARVLGGEYRSLIRDIQTHHRHLLDAYGATNPAEFFAVVTETFFERGPDLRRRHPELYELLMRFYRQDPASSADD